jgi:hypothetical protein
LAKAPKTQRTTASVPEFLDAIDDELRRADAKAAAKLMKAASGEKPYMMGTSIVGFGSYPAPSGDWPVVAFAPRKTGLVLYGLHSAPGSGALLKKLGKHTTGKGCLYVKKLADVDTRVLGELITNSVAAMRAKQG